MTSVLSAVTQGCSAASLYSSALRAGVLAALMACALPAAAANVPRFRAQLLWEPISSTYAVDINNAGQIAAGLGGTGDVRHAFLYDKGRVIDLGFPYQPSNSAAHGLNDRGDLVGSAMFSSLTATAFYYHDGQVRDISSTLAPGQYGYAAAINNLGHVVGQANRRMFVFDGVSSHYIDSPIHIEAGIDINDHDAVAGNYSVNQPFLYRDGRFHGLPLLGCRVFCEGTAMALNNANQVVGSMYTGRQRSPVLWTENSVKRLGRLGNYDGLTLGGALDINERGWVVGLANISDNESRGFLYMNGAMRDVNALLVPDDAARWIIVSANRLNDAGQILANAARAGDPYGDGYQLLLTPVPEPSAWALLLSGLGVVSAAARRRADRRARGRQFPDRAGSGGSRLSCCSFSS